MLISGNAASAHARPGGPLVVPAKTGACEMGFLYSKPTVLAPSIQGYGWAECEPLPADANLTHNYYMQMQRRDASGDWQFVGDTVRTRIVPTPRQNYTVTAVCTAGYYRIYSRAQGTIQGRPFDYYSVSDTRAVNASECG